MCRAESLYYPRAVGSFGMPLHRGGEPQGTMREIKLEDGRSIGLCQAGCILTGYGMPQRGTASRALMADFWRNGVTVNMGIHRLPVAGGHNVSWPSECSYSSLYELNRSIPIFLRLMWAC